MTLKTKKLETVNEAARKEIERFKVEGQEQKEKHQRLTDAYR
jgi:hypothetical protein